MKLKIFVILAICFAFMFTSCSKKAASINTLADLQGKVIGGMNNGSSDANYKKMITNLIGGEPKEIVYYNRAIDVNTAIEAGKIDGYATFQFYADYQLKRKENLKAIPVEATIEGGVIMVVRSEDSLIKAGLDKAITTLKENGTLASLEEKWITNLPAKEEPSASEIPKIKDAKTIYVGVCGDYPPLDYIAADGRPAGYNVAIFTEISKLLNINFEFVSIEPQARFAALDSKKIDLIFTHFESVNTDYFDEFKKSNWVSTIPYYTYKGGCFVVQK
jgi:ABC-type amino acid transport substrate-binding protein